MTKGFRILWSFTRFLKSQDEITASITQKLIRMASSRENSLSVSILDRFLSYQLFTALAYCKAC